MIEKFLKAKHWHIFLLTIGLPMVLQMVLMPILIASNNPKLLFSIMPIISTIFMGTLFGWFWSIAIGLQFRIPENIKMKVQKFKIFFLIPIAYVLIIFGLMFFGFNSLENGDSPGPLFPVIIVPIHLFAMFCIFYSMYFIAKTLKTVELQKEVTFSDFAGDFFLLWFFPIGVWILQPKINKMVETSSND